MDDAIEPACSSRMRGRRLWIKTLGEDASRAVGVGAAEPPRRDYHLNPPTVSGQISEPALIATVHPARSAPAARA